MYLRRAIWACEPWLWASSLFRRSSRSVAPCLWSALGLRIVPICVRAWPAPTPHRADAIAGGWPSSSTPEPSSPAAGGIVSVSRSRRVRRWWRRTGLQRKKPGVTDCARATLLVSAETKRELTCGRRESDAIRQTQTGALSHTYIHTRALRHAHKALTITVLRAGS